MYRIRCLRAHITKHISYGSNVTVHYRSHSKNTTDHDSTNTSKLSNNQSSNKSSVKPSSKFQPKTESNIIDTSNSQHTSPIESKATDKDSPISPSTSSDETLPDKPSQHSSTHRRWWYLIAGFIVGGVLLKRAHLQWFVDRTPITNPLDVRPVTQLTQQLPSHDQESQSDNDRTWCRLARKAQSLAFQLQLELLKSDGLSRPSNFQQPIKHSIGKEDVHFMFDRLDDALRLVLDDVSHDISAHASNIRTSESVSSLCEDSNIELLIDLCLNPLLRKPTRCLALRILDKVGLWERHRSDDNKSHLHLDFADHSKKQSISDRILELASGRELIAFACQFKCVPYSPHNQSECIKLLDDDSISDCLFEAQRRRVQAHYPGHKLLHSLQHSQAQQVADVNTDLSNLPCSPELQSLIDSLSHLGSLTDYLHVYLEQQPDQPIGDAASRTGPDSLPSLHPSIIEEDLSLIPQSAINQSNHVAANSSVESKDDTSLSYVMRYLRSGASAAVATVWGEKNPSISQIIKQRDFQAMRLLASLCDQRDVCEHLLENRLIDHVSRFMQHQLSQPQHRIFTQPVNQTINQSNHQLRLSVQCARLIANVLQHSDVDAVSQIVQTPLLVHLIDWSHADPLDPVVTQAIEQNLKPLEEFPTLINRLAIKSHQRRQAWFHSVKEKLPEPIRAHLPSLNQPDSTTAEQVQPSTQSSTEGSSTNEPNASSTDVDDEPDASGSESAASLFSARHSQTIRAITNLAAQAENKLVDRVADKLIKRGARTVGKAITYQTVKNSLSKSVSSLPVLCDEVYMLHPSLKPLTPIDPSLHEPGKQSLTAPLGECVDPSEPLLDIVFVHGLLGNPIRTWRLHTDHDDEAKKLSANPSDEQLVDLSASGDALDELLLWSQQRMRRFIQPINQSISQAIGPLGVPGTETVTHSLNTQKGDPLEVIWPRDWLPHDLPVPVRILSIGFRSALLQRSINESVNQRGSPLIRRASEFESKLAAARVGADGRSVVFVTHSMGGLLAKQILSSAVERSNSQSDDANVNPLLESTTGLIFMATPHAGAWLPKASRPRALVGYLATPSIELDELERGSEALQRLNQTIKQLVRRNHIEVLSFGETISTPLPPSRPSSLLALLLVPPESSDPGYGAFQLLDEDHLNVCKPHDKQSVLYVKVREFLLKQARQALDRRNHTKPSI